MEQQITLTLTIPSDVSPEVLEAVGTAILSLKSALPTGTIFATGSKMVEPKPRSGFANWADPMGGSMNTTEVIK